MSHTITNNLRCTFHDALNFTIISTISIIVGIARYNSWSVISWKINRGTDLSGSLPPTSISTESLPRTSLRTIINSTRTESLEYGPITEFFVRCLSFADDLRAESAGRRTSWHERNDRLSHGGLSTRDELLVPRRRDDTVQREVHDEHHGEQLQGVHEADHKESTGWWFRQLSLHQQELTGRDRGLDQVIW